MTFRGALLRMVAALDAAGIPYMITGSVASAFHVAPRSTQDIDLVIDPSEEQVRVLIASLPPDAYLADLDSALDALRRRTQFNVLEFGSGWKCDLIIKKLRRFSQEEFERRRPIDVAGQAVFVATREDVLLSKLEWAAAGSSQRQIEDAAMLLRGDASGLDMAHVEHWIAELGLAAEWARARRLAGLDA